MVHTRGACGPTRKLPLVTRDANESEVLDARCVCKLIPRRISIGCALVALVILALSPGRSRFGVRPLIVGALLVFIFQPPAAA